MPSSTPSFVFSIPAQPSHFALDLSQAALVIIDMQRDFIEPGGFGASLGNDVTRLRSIIPTVAKTLQTWRQTGALIVHTREAHAPDLSDCPPSKLDRSTPGLHIGDVGPMGRILIAGEPGNDIIPEVAPQADEWVINKPGKGAFYATGLHEKLQAHGITQLIFMGVTTEVCVQTSMREANDRGYRCLLIEDGTASYFPEFKAAAIAMMTAQGGIVGRSTTSDQLLPFLTSPADQHPDTLIEVTEQFHRYEQALMTNDVETLNQFFWDDPRLTRYGIADRQLGIDEMRAFRRNSPTPNFTRQLENLRIIALSRDTAIAQVEFVRSDTALRGFQTQCWARWPDPHHNASPQWKIVAAHVSMIDFQP